MVSQMVRELIGDRYEIQETLGSGGMSRVYLAHDRRLERKVALKALHAHFDGDEAYVARFEAEARAVARLSHPNIVGVIDRVEDDGRHFIVFEYVEGETLKQLVEREGRLPEARAIELTLEVAAGLSFAHQQGLVHRDVKPQNILVSTDGEVKVTDFGIARSLEIEHGITETGTLLGTSDYLSPEQARGTAASPASDIYSLGVVLFELLTGELPFHGDSPLAVAMQHVNAAPPNVRDYRPDVSPRLAAAVDRALAKDPVDRFPSIGEFANELRRCLDASPGFDEQATLIAAAPPRREHRRATGVPKAYLPAILMALGVLALIAVAIVLIDNHGTSSHAPPANGGTGSAGALRAIGNYDPSGPPDTHADTAGAATDGNPATFWYTQIYGSPAFGGLKRGLGLKLDAGSETKLAHLTVTTGTPGFVATILAGGSPDGPFTQDSAAQRVNGSTTFDLNGANARYYVLWITRLPPGNKAEVDEVTTSG
jgi:serine/threonine-protein kinase